jgi:hypothetical protein
MKQRRRNKRALEGLKSENGRGKEKIKRGRHSVPRSAKSR